MRTYNSTILLGFIGAIELVFGSPLAVCVVCLFLLFSFVKLYVVSVVFIC